MDADQLYAPVVVRGHKGVRLAANVKGVDLVRAGKGIKAALAVGRRAAGGKGAVGVDADQLDALVALCGRNGVRLAVHFKRVHANGAGKLVKAALLVRRRAAKGQRSVGVDADQLEGVAAPRRPNDVRVAARLKGAKIPQVSKAAKAGVAVARRGVGNKGAVGKDADQLDGVNLSLAAGRNRIVAAVHDKGVDCRCAVQPVKVAPGGRRVGHLQGAVGVHADQLDGVVGGRGHNGVRRVAHRNNFDLVDVAQRKAVVAVDGRAGILENAVGVDADQLEGVVLLRGHNGVL